MDVGFILDLNLGLRSPQVRGSNTGGSEIFAPVQSLPGAHTASCTVGTGSFSSVKRPERGFDPPPPSSAEVEGRVELHFYSPSGPSWPVIGRTLPFTFVVK